MSPRDTTAVEAVLIWGAHPSFKSSASVAAAPAVKAVRAFGKTYDPRDVRQQTSLQRPPKRYQRPRSWMQEYKLRCMPWPSQRKGWGQQLRWWMVECEVEAKELALDGEVRDTRAKLDEFKCLLEKIEVHVSAMEVKSNPEA